MVILGITFSLVSQNKEAALVEVKISGATFHVEIADTPAAQARGLSGRDFLAPENGMLFLFPKEEIQRFWMKDMKFPIDIIWIKEDTVVGMVIGAEPESGPDYTVYNSPEPIDKVLEINSGLTQKLGIKIGDAVDLQ